jgi:hypothetical protein
VRKAGNSFDQFRGQWDKNANAKTTQQLMLKKLAFNYQQGRYSSRVDGFPIP